MFVNGIAVCVNLLSVSVVWPLAPGLLPQRESTSVLSCGPIVNLAVPCLGNTSYRVRSVNAVTVVCRSKLRVGVHAS